MSKFKSTQGEKYTDCRLQLFLFCKSFIYMQIAIILFHYYYYNSFIPAEKQLHCIISYETSQAAVPFITLSITLHEMECEV